MRARFADLLGRDFTAAAPNLKWTGDLTEVPTEEGTLYLATTEDLFSRRVLGAATSAHHDAEVAVASLRMAATTRGGRRAITGVIFHTDQGSEYTAAVFTQGALELGVQQSMGPVARPWTTPPMSRSTPLSSLSCSPGAGSPPARGPVAR